MGKLGNNNFELIEEKSLFLLKEKSKNIQVISFLSFVYLRNENWEAYADIFEGLSQLVDKDYEGLFPVRPQAKRMAFKWMSGQRYIDTLESKKPTNASHEHIKRLVPSLTKLKESLEKHFSEGSPFPSRILSCAIKWEKATKPTDAKQEKTTIPDVSSASTPESKESTSVLEESQKPVPEKKTDKTENNVESSEKPVEPEYVASDFLKAICNKFDGDNPFGINLNQELDFDILKTEIGKLGNINWELVEESALTILKEKSKDLRVFSYLSFIYLRNENWEGFVDIFDALSQYVELHYEEVFPTRPRAKQMAFSWMAESRYKDMLESKKPGETAHQNIKRLITSLQKIKQVLEGIFPDGSPFPAGVLSAALKWEKSTKAKPKPAISSKPASKSTAKPLSGASSTQQVSLGSMDNTKEAQANAKKIAAFLIEKEPEKPMGYRLIRTLRWGSVENAPPAEGGKIKVEGPNEQKKTFLKNLTGKEEWKRLLSETEKEFSGGPNHYWLDLQRMSATACKNLGESYNSVYDAICIETALFVKRIPDITGLSFGNGLAFCDDATKDWIESDIAAILSSESQKGSSGHGNPLKDEQKEINQLVSAGKTDEAIDILNDRIRGSGEEQTHFRRSLMLCNVLLSAKNTAVAIAVLEGLEKKIDDLKIDKWEPELAIEALSLLYKTYKATVSKQTPQIQVTINQKQNSILSKISIIDTKSALKLNI